MIYVDSSALVKLVLPEAESSSMIEFTAKFDTLVTNTIGAIEFRRAVKRHYAQQLWAVERVLAEMTILELSHEVRRTAELLEPTILRTLDAIHLASALVIREELEAFVAYDERLLEAARLAGIPTVSPGA